MTSSLAGPSACRVLLTDDDPLVRTVYADVLSARGCDVTQAGGGDEAVHLARALLPDMVLMDLSMPRMDGWATLAALRADPRTSALVVVALTATDTAATRQRAAEAGFDGFIVKPYTGAALLAQVESVWERARDRRPPAPSAPPAAEFERIPAARGMVAG